MVPTCGFSDQVTAWFEVPLTVGTNVALWPPVSDAVPGDKLTLTTAGGEAGADTGCNIKGTDALTLGSAELTAVNVTVCFDVVLAGATYNPFTTLPILGVSDQLTAVFVVPFTATVNCAD